MGIVSIDFIFYDLQKYLDINYTNHKEISSKNFTLNDASQHLNTFINQYALQ